MAKPARLVCSDCGAGLVPTLRGMRCPRLGSCGRGGTEETGSVSRGGSRKGQGDAVNA